MGGGGMIGARWAGVGGCRLWLPLGLVAFSAVKGFVVNLQAEPVPDEVRELGVPGPVEGLDAQQELVVAGGEDSLCEGGRARAGRGLAAEDVDAGLAELSH